MGMRFRAFLVVLLAVCAIAPTPPAAAGEGPRPKRVTYTVVNRGAIVSDVVGLEWRPPGAKTVLLAVHGSSGVKANNWAPMSVPRYSFALWRYKESRATVAIDLPGFGESPGDLNSSGMEDFAMVVAQIAQQLRSEFTHVIGVGHSMGAGVVDITQGMFGSFDAIIPASWSHGGYSSEYLATCGQSQCPSLRRMLFTRHANRRVENDYIKRLEPLNSNLALNIGLYGGFFTRPTVGPALDDLSASVTVPVLVILGKQDFFWDMSKNAEEPSHFPLSSDVTLLQLPGTGHCVFHHLNHAYVERYVGRWLAKRGF